MPASDVARFVVISKESIESDDPSEIVNSNISFLNSLLEEYFTHTELSQDAFRSYYVDYYLAQVENGGFSQFVGNSRWDEFTIRCIREGLHAMGAMRHINLLNQCESLIDRIGPDGMRTFFESGYFGENEERDILDEYNDKFTELSEQEDLVRMNADWLKSHPKLVVMTIDEMKAEVQRHAATIPDREARIARALANEPRYMKLIRALCVTAGHKLDRVTAGRPTFEDNVLVLITWHFLTDKGHFYMTDVDGTASMFNGDTDEVVCVIEATDEFGDE